MYFLLYPKARKNARRRLSTYPAARSPFARRRFSRFQSRCTFLKVASTSRMRDQERARNTASTSPSCKFSFVRAKSSPKKLVQKRRAPHTAPQRTRRFQSKGLHTW